MSIKSVLSVVLIAVLMLTVFSPVVEASVIYGPVKFTRDTGAPGAISSQFTAGDSRDNYTLYVRNGDIINGCGEVINGASSAIVRLNGDTIFSAKDFSQSTYLLKKNVTLQDMNDLQVEVRSLPGSYLTAWVEDESPDIVITSPWDDTVSSGIITLAGYTLDRNITSITLDKNGTTSTIPVENGNFSTIVAIDGPTRLTVSAIDSTGMARTASVSLDGDYLLEHVEKSYGFDSLSPDSDSSVTAESEAGNGIIDGFEVLGGQNAGNTRLPLFVKAKIGADPFKDDTDDDGLTDYFELMKLGLLTDVISGDSDNNGVPDAEEDFDQDGLTNLEEQSLGTDPLVKDTDGDTLSDKSEVTVSNTDPLSKDPDMDGLTDDSEFKFGTDPFKYDTDNDGIKDGDETYTSTGSNEMLGISVSVTGQGDMSKQLRMSRETSEYYTNVSALVSPLVDVSVNGSFDSARITMQYDPSMGLNPANLSLCYFDESLGLYVPVASQVDVQNHTVSAEVTHFSDWGVFEVKNLQALYRMVSDFNNEPYSGQQPGIPQPGDTLLVPYNSTLTMTYLGGTAGYNNIFGLRSPFQKQYGTGHGTAPGTSFNLGTFTRGTELIFYDNNGVGSTWLSGPGSRNPDGIAHAYIKPITNDTWLLGWEDMYGGGDRDYDDVVLNLTFTRTAMNDTDGDGLYDDVETHGIMDALGRVYYTDPNNPDTDGDGLDDGYETGALAKNSGCTYYNLISYPTAIDSDGDGIDDPDEAEFATLPLVDDCDHDGLKDGLELEIGTEPWITDTDGDKVSDFDEYRNGEDPLVYEERFDILVVCREIVLGAVLGDWGSYGDEHDNLYYLAGQLLSGYLAIGDIRDIAASIWHLDALNTLFNAVALVPAYGDAAKTITSVGQFAAKHADEGAKIAGFVTLYLKYDDPATNKMLLEAAVGGDTVASLNKKGYTNDMLWRLFSENIDLKKFDQVLEESKIYNDFNYDGLASFVRTQLTLEGTALKGRCTFDIKKLTNAAQQGKPVTGYMNNLKGAYTEYLLKNDVSGDTLIDLTHVNKGGIDYAALEKATEGDVLKVCEGKATDGTGIPLEKISNYIAKDEMGNLFFNKNYMSKEFRKNGLDPELYLNDPTVKKQFVLYVNGEHSADVATGLYSKLPPAETIPYIDDNGITQMVEIVIMPVYK